MIERTPTQPEATGGCLAVLGRLVQSLLWLALAAGVIGLAGYHFLTNQFDKELGAHILRHLRQQHPQHLVTIRGAKRIPGVGIEVRALAIRSAALSDDAPPLLYAEELLLGCDTDLQELALGDPRLRHVRIRGVKVRITRRADGTWDLTDLLPVAVAPKPIPDGKLLDATIEVGDALRPGARPLVLRDLELRWGGSEAGRNNSFRGNGPQALEFAASFGTDFAPAIVVEGQVSADRSSWELKFQGERIELNKRSVQSGPLEITALAPWLGDSNARLDVHGRCARGSPDGPPLDFEITGRLYDGRLEHERLPFVMRLTEAQFVARPDGIRVPRALAQNGETRISLACDLKGYDLDAPMSLKLLAQNLPLDNRLGTRLPDICRVGWRKFEPEGVADAEFQAWREDGSWHSNLRLDCHDVSFLYERFPYRLEHGSGTLNFHDRNVVIRGFEARANGRPVRLDAEFQNLGPDCTGWVEFQVAEPVPLDERLFLALDERTQRVVRSLNPGGHLTVWGRLERDQAGQRFRKSLEIGIQQGWLTYERFPYPFYQVQGTIRVANDDWWFEKLSGQNDSAYVECSGRWTSDQAGGGVLVLDATAWDVPLEEELRHALRPAVQKFWMALRPRGTIDHMRIGAQYHALSKDLTLDVVAEKWPPQQNVEGRNLRIEPEWFPYAWEDVTGKAHYRNGVIELHDLKAVHGSTRAEAQGLGEFQPDGRWSLRFSRFLADRLNLDHDLLAALPGRTGEALGKLNLSGPLNVSGPAAATTRSGPPRNAIELFGGPNEPLTASWNLLLDLENGTLTCGTKLEHIHGSTILLGDFDGEQLFSRGELLIDSLTHRDLQVTQVRGPFEVTNSAIRFGTSIQRRRPEEAPRQVTATALRGALAGDGQIQLTDQLPFRFEGSLFNGDFHEATEEFTSQVSAVSGRMFANGWLTGNSKGLHTLRGGGQVELKDANLYRLPVMARMLKLLRVAEPSESAFTSSDLKFRLEGDRVYFDDINFHGDVISLREGKGEMDFQRHVKLQFYTMVGREELQIPLLQTMLREASPRILLLHVDGSLDDPQITRELFPEVNEGLREIFPEAAPRRTIADSLSPKTWWQERK